MTSLTSLTSKSMSESREYKMKTRRCLHCGGPIPPEKRADSKFCHNSCKAHHWEQNKGKNNPAELNSVPEKEQPKPQVEKPLEGLRGVIENKTTNDVSNVNDVKQTTVQPIKLPVTTKQVTKETQAYKDALAKKEKAEVDLKRVETLLTTCENKITDWEIAKEKLKTKVKPKRYANRSIDMMDLNDTFWDETSDSLIRDARESEIKGEIISLSENKTKLEQMQAQAKEICEQAQKKLNSTPQFETVQQKPSLYELAMQMDFFKKKAQEKQVISNETQIENVQPEVNTVEPEQTEKPALIQTNGKLKSSREIREIDYKCLNFQGKWKEFLGQPAVVFHCALHGKPGSGKSNFSFQFADYLAKSFGQVVYISGEEGFSKTLQDKIVLNKIDNPYLFFADCKSFEQIKADIENKFHFIFIDSLDTLRIDALRLRELRELYPQSAFITISQSTKDGNMRGSQEIIHDADITVRVAKPIATTTKNRFALTDKEFIVFPDSPKPMPKISDDKKLMM